MFSKSLELHAKQTFEGIQVKLFVCFFFFVNSNIHLKQASLTSFH